MRNIALLINLLLLPVAKECVSCTLVVDTRYIERVTTYTRFNLEVSSWFLSSRLDLDRLFYLMLVFVAGGPQAKREGPVMRCILR
jgi:hypothetical protein